MNASENAFLKFAVPAAQAAGRAFDLPNSITIAQAADESAWGQSSLARLALNFFGVKAIDFTDPDSYVQFLTTEFIDGRKVREMAKFARYTSPAESFKAHAALLSLAPRYKPAMAVRGDPERFAQELQRCGYSTDLQYAEKLMDLVREFDLTQYDIPPDGSAAAQRAA